MFYTEYNHIRTFIFQRYLLIFFYKRRSLNLPFCSTFYATICPKTVVHFKILCILYILDFSSWSYVIILFVFYVKSKWTKSLNKCLGEGEKHQQFCCFPYSIRKVYCTLRPWHFVYFCLPYFQNSVVPKNLVPDPRSCECARNAFKISLQLHRELIRPSRKKNRICIRPLKNNPDPDPT